MKSKDQNLIFQIVPIILMNAILAPAALQPDLRGDQGHLQMAGYPNENFLSLIETENYQGAVEIFEQSSMYYKVESIYGFMKNPVSSPEIDAMFYRYLLKASDTVDDGMDLAENYNWASARVLDYLGKKYSFNSPEIEVWARSGQRTENRKIKAVLPDVRRALAERLPPALAAALPSVVPETFAVTTDNKAGTVSSGKESHLPPSPWRWVIVLLTAILAFGSLTLWRRRKKRSQSRRE